MKRLIPGLLLLALACIYTFKLELFETRRHAAAGIESVSVSTMNGGIRVSAGADSLVSASIKKQAYGRDSADAARAIANIVITDEVQSGQYVLQAQMPSGNRNYGASFEVSVPETTALSLNTANGVIAVSGMLSGISASTSNGHVELTGTAGDADLVTTNGHVSLAVHRGSVEARTTNGRIDCDVAELHAIGHIILETTNGHVVLLLPADVSATVEVTTSNGQITFVDFTPVFQEQTEDHVRATIGSGASNITITTTNGDVRVARRS